eukprot:TRINITY_DN11262_c0_g2_i2.p1 TRINITY_DN11262_c0_g2~~TRINITY_DN11262_c0_g2_i2.p1  ORF type:complete len:652 (+),score=79.38 TRINITY_DN11262_c0_g2_i2:212-2167(+)
MWRRGVTDTFGKGMRVSVEPKPGPLLSQKSMKRKSLVDEAIRMDEKLRSFKVDHDRITVESSIRASVVRMKIDAVLESSFYQFFVAACTLFSVSLVAVETDMRVDGQELGIVVRMLGNFLVVVFAVDLGLRLHLYQIHFFTNALNVLEACLVLLDVVLEFLTGIHSMLYVLGVLRILRFVRLGRILQTYSKTRELFLMIMGIVASARAFVFGVLLLLMTLTVFSILAVYFVRPVNRRLAEQGVYGDCSYCEDAFDNVMNSNLTFLTTIVAGDGWGRQAIPLIREDLACAVIVVGALLVVNLGLLNTIAAVIIDRQVQARADDVAYNSVVQADELQKSLRVLHNLFNQMDESGDDTLTADELHKFYDASPIFRSILNRLDIHKADIPVIFKMLDTDGTDDLTFAEFVNGLYRLKNENMHTLLIFTKHYCESMFERVRSFSVMLEEHDKKADARFRKTLRLRPQSAGTGLVSEEDVSTSELRHHLMSPRRSHVSQTSQDATECESNQSTSSSPAQDQWTCSAELAEVKRIPDVVSTSQQNSEASRSQGPMPPLGPAEVPSAVDDDIAGGREMDVEDINSKGLQTITHAPIGRRPSKVGRRELLDCLSKARQLDSCPEPVDGDVTPSSSKSLANRLTADGDNTGSFVPISAEAC